MFINGFLIKSNDLLITPLSVLPHNPADADKSEGGGDARQVGQVAGRDAGRSLRPRRGSGAGRAGSGRGSRAMAPRPDFYSILVKDVSGAGRGRYMPPVPEPGPEPESGSLLSYNPFAPPPPSF